MKTIQLKPIETHEALDAELARIDPDHCTHLVLVGSKYKSGFFSLGYLQALKDVSETELAQLGADGWELVSVMPIDAPGIIAGTRSVIAFFKRPASQ